MAYKDSFISVNAQIDEDPLQTEKKYSLTAQQGYFCKSPAEWPRGAGERTLLVAAAAFGNQRKEPSLHKAPGLYAIEKVVRDSIQKTDQADRFVYLGSRLIKHMAVT